MPVVAIALAAVLSLIAVVHVYWAVAGATTGAAVPSRADGLPLFRPGRVATFGVAVALLVAVLIVLTRAQLTSLGIPAIVGRVGIWGVAAVFAVRTVGEFRYVGLFKRVTGTAFARWDTRLFTPLCAVIAMAAVMVGALAE